MENKKKVKIVIIVLAVLLGLSLLALGGTLVYNKLARSTPSTVTVPDNLITPDEDTVTNGSDTSAADESGSQTTDGSGTDTQDTSDTSDAGTRDSIVAAPAVDAKEAKKAASIELYNKQPQENAPFKAGNMFPGDSETKYFRVRVSYHDKVTVHYKATVRSGYEKLAEVLKVRVKLLSSGETMYEGLMRDMPESLTYNLASKETVTDELYYEITAYLDTSVGNEYQNKDLIADFKWWVEETGNLDSPQTGDTPGILLWSVLAVASLGMIILLIVVRRRKEEEENG
mgnify:CR=1 FL=1